MQPDRIPEDFAAFRIRHPVFRNSVEIIVWNAESPVRGDTLLTGGFNLRFNTRIKRQSPARDDTFLQTHHTASLPVPFAFIEFQSHLFDKRQILLPKRYSFMVFLLIYNIFDNRVFVSQTI